MKLLYKHIKKDFLAKKTMMAILSLFLMGTSFLYYFVHFSVDKNLSRYRDIDRATLAENEQRYLTALENNTVLIRNMTMAMTAVFLLILFLFLVNTVKKNQAKIGLFKSLGFTIYNIAGHASGFLVIMEVISLLIGAIAGYFGSSILISANEKTYMMESLSKGISFSNLIRLFGWWTLLIEIVTFIAYVKTANKDVALLMKKADTSVVKPGIIEKFIGFFKSEGGYKYKLTFKGISELLLMITAIVTFSIMFVLSVSLLLSSKEIMSSQQEGREYAFETVYDECVKGGDIADEAHLLKFAAKIDDNGEKIDYNIVGLSGDNGLFSLYGNKGEKIDVSEQDGIILNPELSENYGIKVGDELSVEIGGNTYAVKATAVARNAGIKSMYMSKEKLAELIGIEGDLYNCVLSSEQLEGARSVAYEDAMAELSRSQTSNKASAIINQSIGVATGCLLIFLAMFIGLSGNTESILLFDLLGYDNKKINRILLDPYMVVSNIIFVITFPVCVFAAKRIQISTSLATGDYMPFQLSVFTVVYMLVILNILCLLVRAAFTFKIKKIIEGEKQAEYLYEL